MKYQIDNFKISPKDFDNLESIIKSRFKLDDFKYKILHKSIDARDKSNVNLIFRLMIETNKKINNKNLKIYEEDNFNLPYPKYSYNDRPVIVGFGPAGMFSGLYLARCGAKPIIIERGGKVEDRKKDILEFIKNKKLNINSNIQFGEGGAGTFSDGKLTTSVKSKLNKFILNEFVIHGAKDDILYDHMPHIGTDYLELIVKNIREEIISLGGEFYFNHQFIDFDKDDYLNLTIKNLNNNYCFKIKTNHLLLCIGHSARDTIKKLYDKKLKMTQKSFSMGVRIEHKKNDIDYSQYGEFSKYLPSAYYKLSTHKDDRGIYTFCMCPGGYVMASQSEENTILVNGMSNNKRDGENSNSAILVDVKPEDYDKGNELDGIYYQEYYEKLAFNLSKDYRAPANLVKEFLNDEVAKDLRSINTTYPHGLFFTDLGKCLPNFVINGIKNGIIDFDRKLKGFNNPDAILIGIESRSSSPVRILRNDERISNIDGIYPVGEGCGYAGGIMSAAIDGLRTALTIVGCEYKE